MQARTSDDERAMKIIISATLGGRSAGTWYAIETARRLQARGHEVRYLARPGRGAWRRAREAGLPVVEGCDLEEKSPVRACRNLGRLRRLMAEFAPDVIVAHGGEDHTFWGVATTLWGRRIALIRARALDPKPPRRHPLSIWLHRRATDAIVTANSRHYASYRERLRVPSGKLRIIEAGIDPADFSRLDSDAYSENGLSLAFDQPVVVMVARFAPIKGHRVFVSAAAMIKKQRAGVRFLLVGYPVDYRAADFERWLVEANLVDEVAVIDRRLPQLPALLARCAVGVIASVGSETVSRSLLEYLASGLPVVATDVGGIGDLMARGDFGCLVPPDNAARLAEGICEVLSDEETRRRRGAAGRDYVMSHCDWETRVAEWETVLNETVARVRGR